MEPGREEAILRHPRSRKRGHQVRVAVGAHEAFTWKSSMSGERLPALSESSMPTLRKQLERVVLRRVTVESVQVADWAFQVDSA